MLKLGTRGSRLARWQADWCAEQFRRLGIEIEIVVIRTSGDAIQSESIADIGAQGVFTREIQNALLRGEIDVAIHSLKDLPTEPVDGLALGGVPKRGPHRDVFLSRKAKNLEDLPENSRVGTGSLRRKTQILYHYRHYGKHSGSKFCLDDIRGNVETRLRKLDNGEYDALILAEAGLVRLGFADRISSFLEPPDFLPAVGQGALGLEIRSDDGVAAEAVATFSDPATFAAVQAERSFLQELQGGCIAPIAAFASVHDGVLTLHGRILSPDGLKMFEAVNSVSVDAAPVHDAVRVGVGLARKLLADGADAIIGEIRGLRNKSRG